MDYWVKQHSNKPLFPELEWSKPENRLQAGKLAIIGGNVHGFAAPAEAYAYSSAAGIGTAKVLLPDALQKIVGNFIGTAEFATSTPSGSFSRSSVERMLDLAQWADGLLLAGDFGRNSETAIALETFIGKYDGPLIITKDAVDYFNSVTPDIDKTSYTLILTLEQLQKFSVAIGFNKAFTLGMDLVPLIRQLHEFTLACPVNLVVKQHATLAVAVAGQVSTTKLNVDMDIWRVKTASTASTWLIQHPTKPFEALTTAIAVLENKL